MTRVYVLVVIVAFHLLRVPCASFRPHTVHHARRFASAWRLFGVFYDDFEGQSVGESASISFSQQLQTLQDQEKSRLTKNWNNGNWQVRGFSLDPDSALDAIQDDEDQGETTPSIRATVCCIAPDPTDPSHIWVGRTDGSIVGVELGTEYWTAFHSKLKVTAEELDNNNTSFKVSSQLVAQEEDEQQQQGSKNPFQIRHQDMAGSSAVSAILVTEDSALQPYVFTACQGTGEIQQWMVTEPAHGDSDDEKLIRSATLTGAHKDTVLSLCAVSVTSEPHDNQLLFSASREGTIALWDVATGDLLYFCTLADPITAATADGTTLYIGTEIGSVIAFPVLDLLQATETTAACPVPTGQWTASTVDLTALSCHADKGSLGGTVLVTGDSAGTVRQWEILSRPQGSTKKLEPWPRLASQRLPGRAHMFKGHSLGISAVAFMNKDTLLTASADGTVRAWDVATGAERFRMDGFTAQIRSLCLQENLLITDGMEKYVCVHDFDIEFKEEVDEDFFDFDGEDI